MSGDRNRVVVRLVTLPMELIWLSAIALLFTPLDPGIVSALTPMVLSTIAALSLTLMFARIRRRRVVESAAHLVVFAIFLGAAVARSALLPMVGATGLFGFLPAFQRMQGAYDWLTCIVFFALTALFWYRGVRIGAVTPDHGVTMQRFDAGIGVFFAVHLLRLGLQLPDSATATIAYFLVSMVALYAARDSSDDGGFRKARSLWTQLVPFSVGIVVMLVAGRLWFPVLTRTATEVYLAARRTVVPLAPWLIAVLRFLFGFGAARVNTAPVYDGAAGAELSGEAAAGGWAELIERILTWGFASIMVALGLVLAALVVYRTVVYLLARVGGETNRPSLLSELKRFFVTVVGRLARLVRAVGRGAVLTFRRKPRTVGEGQESFRRLCAWGRRSGVTRRATETCSEYGARLVARFPAVADAADVIVGLTESELYGGCIASDLGRARLRRARAGLLSPLLYPARLAARLGFRQSESVEAAQRHPGAVSV